MPRSKNTLLLTLILFPFFIALVFRLNPQSEKLTAAWQRIRISKNNQNALEILTDYKYLLSQQPWHIEQWDQLANVQKDINDYYGMIDSYQHLRDFKELTVFEQLALSEAYFKTNQSEQAFQVLDHIPENDLLSEEYKLIVSAKQQHNDWYSAYQTLLNWYANESEDAFVSYQLGLSQIIFDPENAGDTLLQTVTNNSEYMPKVRAFREGLEEIIKQENLTYRLVLSGQLLSQQSEWEYAIAAFEYVTNIDPEYAEGWALLGNALKYINEDGLSNLKKAQEIDPNSKIAKEMLAVYWRDHNDNFQSMQLLNELAKEDPGEAFWQYEIGNSLIYEGDLYGALDAFQKATMLSPDDSFYWKNLAQFTIDYKILMETIGLSAARQALILTPDDAMSYDLLGVIYLGLENYSMAERFLIQANEKQPLSSLVHLHLGQLYLKTGKINDSYIHLTRSIDLAQNEEIKMMAQNFLDSIK